MKKIALTLLLALSMAPVAAMAEVGVAVRVGPPAPIVEHYGPPPHRGYVWIAGYNAGMVGVTCGLRAAGPHLRDRTLYGFRITGYTGAVVGCWSKGTGATSFTIRKGESGALTPLSLPADRNYWISITSVAEAAAASARSITFSATV